MLCVVDQFIMLFIPCGPFDEFSKVIIPLGHVLCETYDACLQQKYYSNGCNIIAYQIIIVGIW